MRLPCPRNGIRKLKNQIESLSAVVDLWWSWVDQCLAAMGCELNVVNWVKDYLLPAAYWQQQVRAHQESRIERELSSSFGENTRVSQESSRYH